MRRPSAGCAIKSSRAGLFYFIFEKFGGGDFSALSAAIVGPATNIMIPRVISGFRNICISHPAHMNIGLPNVAAPPAMNEMRI
jgi:hypothetical protein